MEKLTENMIRFAESKLGSPEYVGWCLAFIEDALEISNQIEIYGGGSKAGSVMSQNGLCEGECMMSLKLIKRTKAYEKQLPLIWFLSRIPVSHAAFP